MAHHVNWRWWGRATGQMRPRIRRNVVAALVVWWMFMIRKFTLCISRSNRNRRENPQETVLFWYFPYLSLARFGGCSGVLPKPMGLESARCHQPKHGWKQEEMKEIAISPAWYPQQKNINQGDVWHQKCWSCAGEGRPNSDRRPNILFELVGHRTIKIPDIPESWKSLPEMVVYPISGVMNSGNSGYPPNLTGAFSQGIFGNDWLTINNHLSNPQQPIHSLLRHGGPRGGGGRYLPRRQIRG